MKLHWLNKVIIKYKHPIKVNNHVYRIDKFYISKEGVKDIIDIAKEKGAIKKIYILN